MHEIVWPHTFKHIVQSFLRKVKQIVQRMLQLIVVIITGAWPVILAENFGMCKKSKSEL